MSLCWRERELIIDVFFWFRVLYWCISGNARIMHHWRVIVLARMEYLRLVFTRHRCDTIHGYRCATMGGTVLQALGSSRTIHDVEEGSARSELAWHRGLDLRGKELIDWTSERSQWLVRNLRYRVVLRYWFWGRTLLRGRGAKLGKNGRFAMIKSKRMG